MIDVTIALLQLAFIAYLCIFALLLAISFCFVAPWVIGVALVNLVKGKKFVGIDDLQDDTRLLDFNYDFDNITPEEIILDVETIGRNHYAGVIHSSLHRDAAVYPFVLRGAR